MPLPFRGKRSTGPADAESPADGPVVAYVRLPVWEAETVATFLGSTLPLWRDEATWATPGAGDAVAAGPPIDARWHANPATGRAPRVTSDADGGVVLGLVLETASSAPGELRLQAEQTLGHLMRLARVREGYATQGGAPPADAAAWRRAVRARGNLLSTA